MQPVEFAGDSAGGVGGSGCMTGATERGTSRTAGMEGKDVYVDVGAEGARVDAWLCVDTELVAGNAVVGDVGVKARTGGSTNVACFETVLDMEFEAMCAGSANTEGAWVVVSANIGGGSVVVASGIQQLASAALRWTRCSPVASINIPSVIPGMMFTITRIQRRHCRLSCGISE